MIFLHQCFIGCGQWTKYSLYPKEQRALFCFSSLSLSLSLIAKPCPTLGTPWTIACQAPLSTEFSRNSTGVGCHFFLQGIFLTQGLNSGLLHCRQILHPLSYQGSPLFFLGYVKTVNQIFLLQDSIASQNFPSCHSLKFALIHLFV